jgi:methanethiol S-methyltransferase
MKKVFVLSYSLICYLIGLAVVAWYADFFVGYLIPKSINSGSPSPGAGAIFSNLSLILIFTIPHTLMARPSVKTMMRKYIPFAMERSTYILISSITLLALCILWEPMPATLFDVRGYRIEPILWTLYGIGWFFTLFSTFLIDHFDLFGLKQAWYYGQTNRVFRYRFVTPFFYKMVRHPIYLGWLMVHWCTPHLTAGQFLLASLLTIYILIAVEYEERDLLQAFGEQYRKYRESTPKLIPLFSFSKKNQLDHKNQAL